MPGYSVLIKVLLIAIGSLLFSGFYMLQPNEAALLIRSVITKARIAARVCAG
jgi:regulator of protease activity HflC (stomatin/prohibitin superfamily)